MTKKVDNTKSSSIATRFTLNATHNGIKCLLKESAERPCDRAWFTAKQIEIWSGMNKMTLNRRLHKLEECGRISRCSDLLQEILPTSNGGAKETTLYNLNVLNQLAMAYMDYPVLNETAKKFSDILSEVETTCSYNSTERKLLLDVFKALDAEK